MAYSNFTLPLALEQFELTLTTKVPLFPKVKSVDAGPVVKHALDKIGQLALRINTDKARAEWMIAPVLGEMWDRGKHRISLISGVDFTVDAEIGLTGLIDYLVGTGPQLSYVTSPILLAIVEGMNESIPSGQGQCAAEMVASLRFNHKAKSDITTVYGVVTTGDNWRFHRLHGNEFAIDTREYLISEVDQILGILLHIVGLN